MSKGTEVTTIGTSIPTSISTTEISTTIAGNEYTGVSSYLARDICLLPVSIDKLMVPYIYMNAYCIIKPNITDNPGELANDGVDCWQGCNKKQGKCDWCGTEGWCCRMNWKGNGCDGSIGGANNHQCTLNPKVP